MAGAAGFEPATLGFGDRCSTSLSYAPAELDLDEHSDCEAFCEKVAVPERGCSSQSYCTMFESLLYNSGNGRILY